MQNHWTDLADKKLRFNPYIMQALFQNGTEFSFPNGKMCRVKTGMNDNLTLVNCYFDGTQIVLEYDAAVGKVQIEDV